MADAALVSEIDAQEGVKSAPYKDTKGLWTFGTGRCLETNPLTSGEWKYLLDGNLITVSLSSEGADWLEQKSLDQIARSLAATFAWWSSLAPARQDALADMAYQMGTWELMAFKEMLTAVSQGNWDEAYTQALASDWAKQTPARAQQVAQQLRDGLYPQEST